MFEALRWRKARFDPDAAIQNAANSIAQAGKALRWRNAQFNTDAAMQRAARGVAQAGKAPLLIGSLAAMAILGMVTRMRLNHRGRGRSKATVIPARFRAAVEDAVSSAPRNGRRRKRRKTKAAAH
jgi:hypothetical protein